MSTHADTRPDRLKAAHRHACPESGCPGAECFGGRIDGCGHPTKSAEANADDDGYCPWSCWPCHTADGQMVVRHALTLRRRTLALIATEAPGQDVAGVVVIDDALRIDFVSGAALLVGADGTLSWEPCAMSKLTDALRDCRVFNDHEFFNEKGQVWVAYNAADGGRGGRAAHATVYRRGYKTHPDGHWRDYGNKTFSSYSERRPEGTSPKAHCIALAQAWAAERYGVTEWARSPFGGYGDAAFVKARLAALKVQIKARP